MIPPKKPRPPFAERIQQHIPLRRALLWICLSVVAVSGTSYAGFLYYSDLRDRQRRDPAYDIVALVQTSSEPMLLSTACLSELLDLSADRPKNLFCFDTKGATEKLKRVPVIKDAKVSKSHPGVVHVDYLLRKPVALLGDYSNTALDADGVTFPLNPFFTPKRLPEIYLGQLEGENEDCSGGCKGPGWGEPLSGRRAELALALLDLLARKYSQPLVHVRCVDVSRAFASSCGERQIVVTLEELVEMPMTEGVQLKAQPRILRLGADNYEMQLDNYLVLQKHLWSAAQEVGGGGVAHATVVDLRLSNLAFIDGEL